MSLYVFVSEGDGKLFTGWEAKNNDYKNQILPERQEVSGDKMA